MNEMTGSTVMPTIPLATGGFDGMNSWAWIIILFALIFNGNGFGFGNGANNLATTDFVSNEFTQRDINGGFQNQSNLISSGFTDTATGLCGVRSEVLENRYANQLSECQTQRDVLTQTNELNVNLLTTALQNQSKMDECCCTLRAEGIQNTQKILDALNSNVIADLREKLNEAQTVISNQAIESSIINSVRPYPTPSYIVSSPYQSIYNPYNYYGNGFYGSTII